MNDDIYSMSRRQEIIMGALFAIVSVLVFIYLGFGIYKRHFTEMNSLETVIEEPLVQDVGKVSKNRRGVPQKDRIRAVRDAFIQ